MKFNKNILLVGAAIVSLAACKQEAKAPTEAEIDKLVNEKVEKAKQDMQTSCDEMIMAMANAKADSILGVALNKPATRTVVAKPKKVTPTKKTPVVKEKEPETVGNGKPKMGGSKAAGTVGNGKPKMGAASESGSTKKTIGGGKPKMGGK